MKEPVDHILRPRLPWRSANEPGITECGYDSTKVKTITRDEFLARLKEYGDRRTAMLTCMTCSDTIRRWATWDDDPRKAVGREIEWETAWRGHERGDRMRDELLAIAELIAAHPEEFANLLSEHRARDEWIARKAAKQKQPKQPPTKIYW